MRYRNVRRGIETSLLRREQGLKYIRLYFARNMADCLDAKALKLAREAVMESLHLHIEACQAIFEDVRIFEPSYFDPATRKMAPLTKEVLAERHRRGELLAVAHADEEKKRKARREKST